MEKYIMKSDPYYYGKGYKFLTREEAMAQALYTKKCMLDDIITSRNMVLNGEAEVFDVYRNALQVLIPIMFKN